MAISAEQKAHITDLFVDLGSISTRPMMGGLCIYCNDQIFAIISSTEQVYLKASGALADMLDDEGETQFSMTRKNGSIGSMGYWTLPEAALDDPELACKWGRRALQAMEKPDTA